MEGVLEAIHLPGADIRWATASSQRLGGRAAETPNLVLAGVMIAIAVPVTLFVLAQRYFVENVATSGI